jgi:3-oxoacyl-[acyl-carrier-protein] synthase-3
MKYASIGPIAVHLPDRVEQNDALAREHPGWDMGLIYEKTGVWSRHIAAEGESTADLGQAAAERLIAEHDVDPGSIDFLLFCTQTPDYPLPTTACLLQHRLGLSKAIGALDFNLGCSGFVYGLSLADGLIRAGSARRVLLITSETYSRYIDPQDRSLRPIFGDGAAATLIDAADEPTLGPFIFGTDGSGGDALMVTDGGRGPRRDGLKPRGRKRWPSTLHMDGPALVQFTLEVVPRLTRQLLDQSGWSRDQIDFCLVHQATAYMLEHLRSHLDFDTDRLPIGLNDCGNTVSCTLPLLINDLRGGGQLVPEKQSLMIGFGVGYSWAGCTWIESWPQEQTLPIPRPTHLLRRAA